MRSSTRLNHHPRSHSAQNRKPCPYPDHKTIAAYERFGDRTLNREIRIVRGRQLRSRGINLSTNVGAQRQLIE
jgi:hypothetical protein